MPGFPQLNEQMDAIRRGVVEIIPEEDLARKIERSLRTGEPLVVKQGFDPTRPDLHLGHLVSIRKLRTFQELGHRVVFLIGDFTALVGDPSGQSATRPRLTEQEVERNAATYREQVFKVLDREHTTIDRNSRWHGAMMLADVLTLTSHYTVARMLERDDYAKRYASQTPISVHEFLYPLLQGYDSVALRADVEVGGTDQKFNLLVGRTLMERYGLEPQVAVVMPLLRGIDGGRKMSQSYDNYIGITESPEDVYGKTMSIPDTLLAEWTTLVSSLAPAELPAALERCRTEPYAAKRRLAADLVTQFHGAEAAARAAAHFDRLFKAKDAPLERPRFTHAPASLATVLKDVGFAKSLSEARRMVQQGGVQLDGRKAEDANRELAPGRYVVKYGKLKFADVVIG
ncbi:MAG: tyrosine--tRNA ligase [Gemmatimonadetes bacterium GWC2_71_9]|nr:MAG: tyrosine--tRNA ligase [Gemmatimonadetes bacterium GWC2_71_9]OGT95556.1 MAG: tyrosine--tRNA ligase [Gemmatimonadetes bacterium RIFCSPLOWO2_02_FULL_71_11]